MPPRRLTLRPKEFPFERSQDSGLPLKLVTTRHGTKVSNPSGHNEFGNNGTQHLGEQSSSLRARGDDKGSPPAWLERALEVPEHGQARAFDKPSSSRRCPSFHRPVPRRASRHPQHPSLATIDSSGSLPSRKIECQNYGSAPASIDPRVSSPRASPQMLPPFLAYRPLTYPNDTLHEYNSPTPLLADDGGGRENNQASDHSRSRLSFQTWPEEQSSQTLEYNPFPSHISQSSPLLSMERRKSQLGSLHEREWKRRLPTEAPTLYHHSPLLQESYPPPQSPSQSLRSHNVYPRNPKPDRYLLKLASAAEAIASSEADFSSPLGLTLPIDLEDGLFDSSTSTRHDAFSSSTTSPCGRIIKCHRSEYLMNPSTRQHLTHDDVEAFRQVSQETAQSDHRVCQESTSSHQHQPLEAYETSSPIHTTWSNPKYSPSLNVWKKHQQVLSDPFKYKTQSNSNIYEEELSDPDILAQTQANPTTFSEIKVSKEPYNEKRNDSISPTFLEEDQKAVFAELKALTRPGTKSIHRQAAISPAQVTMSPSVSVAATEEIQQEVEEPGDWAGLEQLLEEYPESTVDFDEDGSGPGFVIWQDPDIS